MAQNKLGPDTRRSCLSQGLPPVVMAAIEATTVLAELFYNAFPVAEPVGFPISS